MILKQILEPKLAHYAYLIGCQETGSAIIIDPQRDIDRYIGVAQQHGLHIEAAADTHIHADYLSGVPQFANREGITVYASDEGDESWKFEWLRDSTCRCKLLKHGDRIEVGRIVLEVMHTPGHTPEHISFLITDTVRDAATPVGLLTGDFVFVGDVGRPDLIEVALEQPGEALRSAEVLFGSLQMFKQWSPTLMLWPGHGAGSACGRSMGSLPISTVGYELATNPSIRAARERSEFIDYILDGQPEAPPYFARMKQLNRLGPPVLAEWPRPQQVDMDAFQARLADAECTVIDTRSWEDFRAGHLPGSLFIPLTSAFSTLVASYVSPESRVSFIVDPQHLDEVVRHCIRVGIDRLDAYVIPDQFPNRAASNGQLASVTEIAMADLPARLKDPGTLPVDVRRSSELIPKPPVPGARNLAHALLGGRHTELPPDRELYVYCNSGNRSRYATALLASKGYTVTHVTGGIEAWMQLNPPPPGG